MGDALGAAGRILSSSFQRLGYDFVEIRLSEANALEHLNRVVTSTSVEFVLSYVGMAADLAGKTSDGNEINFWQGSNLPFISLYGDTPAYFFDRHVLPGRSFGSLYDYPEHCALRKRLPNANGLLGIIPPAVVDPIPRETIDFSAKTGGKLLFLKNGNDPDKLLRSWSESLSEIQFAMIADLASELSGQLASNISNDIDTLVCRYFENKGLDVLALTNLRLFFIAQLDDYCRRLKSTMIAEALMDFPVDVHGFNWGHLDFSGKRARLIPFADFGASRALIRDSLGIIDMSPNTGLSPHDRPRRAFGSYTLCLTNEQEYFSQRFPQHDTFTFKFEKETLQTRVAEVLRNPKRAVELGIEVAEAFRKDKDPDGSARHLLDTASALRLEISGRLPGLQDYFAWPATKIT